LPIDKKYFDKFANPLTSNVNGQDLAIQPTVFSSGSLGWKASTRQIIKLGEKDANVLVNVNMVLLSESISSDTYNNNNLVEQTKYGYCTIL